MGSCCGGAGGRRTLAGGSPACPSGRVCGLGGDGILGGVHCGHVLADAPGKNVGSRNFLLVAIEYSV